MNILFVSSWATQCGIATYSQNLIEQLEKQGCKVEVFSDTKNFTGLVKLAKDVQCAVVHIQHEFGISVPTEALLSLIGKFKSTGKPVVITTHTESDVLNILLDGVADGIVLHNDINNMHSRHTFTPFYKIPHGIPEVTLSDTKPNLRKQYNIPETAFVIGTCGFMSPDRGRFLEDTIFSMLSFIKQNPDVYFHIVTSKHRGDQDGQFTNLVHSTLTKLSLENGFSNRFIMTKDFMPTQEFRDRLSTLDIGIAMAPPQVASNSGAAADLVSCGVPVVVNRAMHFSHISKYCFTVETVTDIPRKVIELYNDKATLNQYKLSATEAAKELGYSVVAKKHIEIYESLNNAKSFGTVLEASNKPKKELSKELPINVTCPNSLWQTLLLWKKLSPLIAQGHKLNFFVQNDGLTDLTVLKFALPGVANVQFTDVGMGQDNRLVRLFSRSLAQNMTTDIERWIEDGNTYNGMFEYPNSRVTVMPEIILGSFAESRAAKITTGIEDPFLVVNVTEASDINRTKYWINTIEEELNRELTKLVLIGAPLFQDEVLKFYNDLNSFNQFSGRVTSRIEDIRTRWAICKAADLVLTPWDEIGAYCVISGLRTFYDTNQQWQEKLITELDEAGNAAVLNSAQYGYEDTARQLRNSVVANGF